MIMRTKELVKGRLQIIWILKLEVPSQVESKMCWAQVHWYLIEYVFRTVNNNKEINYDARVFVIKYEAYCSNII